ASVRLRLFETRVPIFPAAPTTATLIDGSSSTVLPYRGLSSLLLVMVTLLERDGRCSEGWSEGLGRAGPVARLWVVRRGRGGGQGAWTSRQVRGGASGRSVQSRSAAAGAP